MVLVFNPRQMILVSCRGSAEIIGIEKEKDSVFATSWHTPVSFNPPRYAVVVSKKMDFAIKLIRSSEVFVVNFVPFELREEIVKCGEISGEHNDSFKYCGLTMAEAVKIDCGAVQESVGFLECRILKEDDAGDHVLFVADIVHSEFKDKLRKRLFHVDKDEFTTTV